jgi:hypothetical protein
LLIVRAPGGEESQLLPRYFSLFVPALKQATVKIQSILIRKWFFWLKNSFILIFS